jgi:hypothetical protein
MQQEKYNPKPLLGGEMEENVDLALYRVYSQSDVRSWVLDSISFTDGVTQFLSTKYGLLCLSPLGPAPSWYNPGAACAHSYFFSPGSFFWIPDQNWLLAAHDPTERRFDLYPFFRRYHDRIQLFVQDAEGWCYVGVGHLSTSCATNGVTWKYGFQVDPTLPRDLWVKLGGYPGWLVIIGHDEHLVIKQDNVDYLLLSDWGKLAPELTITRYEGDSLFAIKDDSGRAVVKYFTAGGELISHSPVDPRNESERILFLRSDGWEVEVDAVAVISSDEAVRIIKAFLATGCPVGLR